MNWSGCATPGNDVEIDLGCRRGQPRVNVVQGAALGVKPSAALVGGSSAVASQGPLRQPTSSAG